MRSARFEREQRLVAEHGVERLQPAGEMLLRAARW